MNSTRRFSLSFRRYLGAILFGATAVVAQADDSELVAPKIIVADRSLSAAQREALELAARRYDTFWNTGDERLVAKALAPDFVDMTPPPGRVQGPQGPLLASRGFRAAVPDLRCEIEQMIVAGDRVVVHLRFRGHFTGLFEQRQGDGHAIEFIATDIYQVRDGLIKANWHLEDNLTLMKQLRAL